MFAAKTYNKQSKFSQKAQSLLVSPFRLPNLLSCAAMLTLMALLFTVALPVNAYADTESELAAARSQLEEIGNKVNELNDELDSKTIELDSIHAEVQEKETKVQETQDVLSAYMSTEYKSGGVSLISIILDSESLSDAISRISYFAKVQAKIAEAINAADQAKKELETKETEQQASIDTTQTTLDELNAQKDEASALVESLNDELVAQLQAEAEANAALAVGLVQTVADNPSTAEEIIAEGESNTTSDNSSSDNTANNTASNTNTSSDSSNNNNSSAENTQPTTPEQNTTPTPDSSSITYGFSQNYAKIDCSNRVVYLYQVANGQETLYKTIQATGSFARWRGNTFTVYIKARWYWQNGYNVNDYWVGYLEDWWSNAGGSANNYGYSYRYVDGLGYDHGAGFHYGFSSSGCVAIPNMGLAEEVYNFLGVGSKVIFY